MGASMCFSLKDVASAPSNYTCPAVKAGEEVCCSMKCADGMACIQSNVTNECPSVQPEAFAACSFPQNLTCKYNLLCPGPDQGWPVNSTDCFWLADAQCTETAGGATQWVIAMVSLPNPPSTTSAPPSTSVVGDVSGSTGKRIGMLGGLAAWAAAAYLGMP